MAAHWPFNTSITNDISGQANHAIAYSDTTLIPHHGGFALQFDGVDDWLDFPADRFFPQVTTAVWVKADAVRSTWLVNGWHGNNNFGLGIHPLPGADQVPPGVFGAAFSDYHASGSRTGEQLARSLFTVETNRWYHLAMTADQERLRLYVDGRLEQELPAAPGSGGYDPALIPAPDIQLGRVGPGVPSDRYFAGAMDDFRLYSRALSPEEIRALYEASVEGGSVMPGEYSGARGTTSFLHDSLDRLLAAVNDGHQTLHHGYDPAGNRTNYTVVNPVTISPVLPVTLRAGVTNPAVAFEVNHRSLSPDALQISVRSGHRQLLPPSAICLAGEGSRRRLLFSPPPNAQGTVTVQLVASDGTVAASESFLVTILPPNNPEPEPPLQLPETYFLIAPSLAPNSSLSPNYLAYATNAIRTLRGLQGAATDPTLPAAYTVLTRLAAEDLLAGDNSAPDFRHWRGQVAPAPPFADERGNRIHFTLHAVSQTPFRLHDLRWRIRSSDPANALAYTGGFSTESYHPATRVGLWWGPDQKAGTGDDQFRFSDEGVQPVNELFFVGAGTAFRANSETDIAAVRNYVTANQPFTVTAEYYLERADGTRSATGLRSVSTAGEPRPAVVAESAPDGTLTLRLGSETGVLYEVLAAPGLETPVQWTPVARLHGLVPLSIQPTHTQQFYRFVPLE